MWDDLLWMYDNQWLHSMRALYFVQSVQSHIDNALVSYDPDRLTINGHFHKPYEGVKVYIGDVLCPIDTNTESQIVCNTPKALAGRFDVIVETSHGRTESVSATFDVRISSKSQSFQSERFGGNRICLSFVKSRASSEKLQNFFWRSINMDIVDNVL